MGLIFLAILMLTVATSFMLSTNNFKAVSNMQSRVEAAAAISIAVEHLISTSAIFITPVVTTLAADAYGNVVTIDRPVCTRSVAIEKKDSGDPGLNLFQEGVDNEASAFVETYWDISATATNGSTGARVETHQGIKIILPADPNPC